MKRRSARSYFSSGLQKLQENNSGQNFFNFLPKNQLFSVYMSLRTEMCTERIEQATVMQAQVLQCCLDTFCIKFT